MMDRYCKTMNKLTPSDSAVAQFYEKLEAAAPKKKHRWLRPALAAACLCLLIPLAVLAANGGFAKVMVSPITDPPRSGKGYSTSIKGASVRPVADFSPELQRLNGSVDKTFASWQDAEDYVGFQLIDNPVLFSDGLYKDHITVQEENSTPSRYHCTASFVGDGQIYFGFVNAHYRIGDFRFAVRATVVADHPQATTDFLESVHGGSTFYPGSQVTDITTEDLTTQNGIPYALTTVTMELRTDYEANFFQNGVSYRIFLSGHGRNDDAAAKQFLQELMDGFQ